MIWDPCLATAVASEIQDRLRGARARSSVLDREGRRAVVWFRESTLVADLSGKRGVILVGEPAVPDPASDPLAATLRSVEALPDERILLLRFRRVRGKRPDPALILDLTTTRWNAFVAEGPDLRIRQRLRIIEGRSPDIGQPWPAPDPGRREGVGGSLSPGRFAELVEGSDPGARRSALLSGIAHTSGLNADYILQGRTPQERFARWRRLATMEEVAPHMISPPSGRQPYPWALGSGTPLDSLLDGMTRIAAADSSSPGADSVERVLAGKARRLARKRDRLADQLEKAGAASQLREDAALILSALHAIPEGAEQVTLPGFDGEERTLHLDPRARPQDHANALFRRAARLERATAALPDQIRGVEQDLEELEALGERYRRGEVDDDELRRLVPPPPTKGGPTPRPGPSLPYKTFRSTGGLEIRVGRGAKHNDDLTFHHCRPDDVWLHARHAAGAHVVLRWTRPERPPAADLEEAAILAALHSKSRGSGHVPVDWTRRKWVRKPRGTPRGTVALHRAETLFVTPDPRVQDTLAVDG